MNFFKQFIKSAKYTGAIAPSTSFLAKKMVSLAKIKTAKTIVELGPGSGAITKEIIQTMPEGCRLVTFDINPEFVQYLKKKYPQAEHFQTDIRHLGQTAKNYAVSQVDLVFSGIPFVDFKKEDCDVMLSSVEALMHENSRLVLFTYSPIKFKTFYRWFEKVRMVYVPLNIPPAYVLVLKKRGKPQAE